MFKLIRNIVVVTIVFFIGYLFGFQEVRFFRITSSSMEPSLRIDDRIVTVKASGLKRRDIVTVRDPVGSREILVKRVIGLPGEEIEIHEGRVFVDGEMLHEPYVKDTPLYEGEFVAGGEQYFLLGDNRNMSEDSSSWGPVDGELIRGKVISRYWPYRDFELFDRPTF